MPDYGRSQLSLVSEPEKLKYLHENRLNLIVHYILLPEGFRK